MTADLSEGETESRPPNASSELRQKVDVEVGASVEGDRLKGGHWKESKDLAGNQDELEIRTGDEVTGKHFRGTADLTTGFRASLKGRPKPAKHDHGAVVQGKPENGKQLPSRRRNVELLSSEGDRDEETEIDFEEVDGAVAEVDCDSPQQQPHQGREHDHGSHRKEPQQAVPTPQPAAAIVGWESVLPQRNIRVLLAEDDDSTRHVVGALLRNCGYEVSSVANGMQAWEMLEDPSNHFDLVLTDVVMPCLSGVGLLTKIMNHEAGKIIPVVLMSSHDSLDIVFRCLSKGAADFLVKPVRKNELKNLWQHVWRCQSSSGSGGGSGSGNGKVGLPKSRVGSGNNTASNDGSDDNSSGLNVRGGSDNGSGTQTVAHVNQKLKRGQADAEEGQATSFEKLSNHQMGQDLEMATRRTVTLAIEKERNGEVQNGAEAMEQDSPSTSGNSGNKLEKSYEATAANSGGSSAKAIDLIGGIAFQNKADVDEGVESGDGVDGSDRGASNSPANDKCVSSSDSPPMLELSLKRPRVPGEDDTDPDEKRVLRHSGGSAFSRYSTSGTIIQQMPAGNPLALTGYPMGAYGTHTLPPAVGPSGHMHFSMPIERLVSSKGSGDASTPLPTHPRLSQNVNGQDVGSSMVGSSTPERYSQQVKDEAASMSGQALPILPPPGMIYDGVSAAYGPGMHQVFYSHATAPPWASGTTQLSERGEVFDHPPYHEHGSHHSHHHSHHHQHQPHNHPRLPQPSLHSQQDDQLANGAGAPRCGSSNMAGSLPDGNGGQSGSSNGYGSNGNGSVNGSGSGSNNLSNQNGQSCVALNTAQNGDGAGNNGNVAIGPNGVVLVHEQNRFARREAALNKFRQKRKERCFEKKVRYQSRKRLAEQRPRVRGQFVRQAVYDSNAGSEMAD